QRNYILFECVILKETERALEFFSNAEIMSDK
ncbi:unnamed protein product, partial [marine sediment metagenome]